MRMEHGSSLQDSQNFLYNAASSSLPISARTCAVFVENSSDNVTWALQDRNHHGIFMTIILNTTNDIDRPIAA